MDIADFHVIADDHVIAAHSVGARTDGCAEVTMDAMYAETAQSSDHLGLQRRPSGHRHEHLDNDMPLPGANSAKDESMDLVGKVIQLTHRVKTLEDLMSKVRHAHEVAPSPALQLHHCSSRHCFRFANAPGWHTCCSTCSNWGSHYHTCECLQRQTDAMKTLVTRQELLETIMAMVDQLPPGA